MEAQVGDTIAVEAETVAQAERTGVIEEVIEGKPPRYRVRWSDGRITIFVPSAGSARVVQGQGA